MSLVANTGCDQDSPPPHSLSSDDSVAAALAEFARRFDAKTDWPPRGFSSSVKKTFTIDLQDSLVDNQSTIVFDGELIDVRRDRNQVFATLGPYLGIGPAFLDLLVPDSLTGELLASPRDRMLSRVVVAARVTDVLRPMFTPVAASDLDDPTLAVLEPSAADFFLIRGKLLAVRIFPGINLEQLLEP